MWQKTTLCRRSAAQRRLQVDVGVFKFTLFKLIDVITLNNPVLRGYSFFIGRQLSETLLQLNWG